MSKVAGNVITAVLIALALATPHGWHWMQVHHGWLFFAQRVPTVVYVVSFAGLFGARAVHEFYRWRGYGRVADLYRAAQRKTAALVAESAAARQWAQDQARRP